MQVMKILDISPQHGKPVGIWIRVSTEDQAQGDSPQHHEMRARHYAAAKGWDVKEIYDLAGVSGKSVMEHPEAKRMLADIRRGHISALLFSKLARLTRNARELMDFSDLFREHNADLVSLQESIDTGTPSGRLFYNIVAVMAQWEREEIGDRVRASIAIRAKLGKPLNGKAPFGYVWKDKKLQPHPDEAPVRSLMYELFAEHQRKKTVARLLNERGYRTRDGSRFSDTSVGRLIADPTAKGTHRANYTRRVGDKMPWALKPEHEWVLKEVEPIVSPVLWERCNDLLESRKTKMQRPAKRAVHLFAGLTFCECGTKMYVPTNSPKYVCTNCRNKIPVVDLEGIFLDEMKNYLLSPDRVAEYLKGATGVIGEKTRLLETLRKEYEKATREAERVYRLYMDEGLTSQQFKELYNPVDARKKQLEDEMPRVQSEVDLLQIDGLSSEYIMTEVKDIDACWPTMTPHERRNIVEILVKKVIVGQGQIDISLWYLPTFKEMTNGQRLV
jgi:site-specific DNA recombinase